MKYFDSNKNKSISKVLLESKSKTFSKLINRASQIDNLNQYLRPKLGSDLAENCYAISSREGKITLLASSPVWAQKLKFLKFQILDVIKKNPDYSTSINIEVKVDSGFYYRCRPKVYSNNKPKLPPRYISKQTSQMLMDSAEYVKDDKLSATLLRIAQFVKK